MPAHFFHHSQSQLTLPNFDSTMLKHLRYLCMILIQYFVGNGAQRRVPQGSIVSTLLMMLFINDVNNTFFFIPSNGTITMA